MERPIIFSAAMVRAILEGRKTQTRRVVAHRITGPNPPNPPGVFDCYKGLKWCGAFRNGEGNFFNCCPYGKPGDRLWVREAFCVRWFSHGWPVVPPEIGKQEVVYRADLTPAAMKDEAWLKRNAAGLRKMFPESRWKPSIHMPRWASRISLEITKVRVQRVQEINAGDASDEGCPLARFIGSLKADRLEEAKRIVWFKDLWDSINADRGYGWEKNPWVWVIEFKKL